MINFKEPLIFIVEDEPAMQVLIEKTLKANHFKHIQKFNNGEDCVKAIENGELPDIVLQDFDLPGMNGLEVMIKAKNCTPKQSLSFYRGRPT
ncbi:MAG: response regulator [Bacteroidales bacterium]|nr:response regulator [Bacteroidales bacterium]